MAFPPLVAIGPELDATETDRTARQRRLPQLGETGQRRLANARVLVLGAGGLGSPALLYLAAAGVGTLGIVDDDVVEISNLQRQLVHTIADLGRTKTSSAAEALGALAPGVTVVQHAVRLDASNAVGILGDYDLVIDGTDNFATRYLSNDVCAALGLPLVWGSVLRFDAQISVFWANPPSGSGIQGVQLRDLYPAQPEDDGPNCADAGVLGALCGQVGSLMATEAVKLITGIGNPLIGRVLVIDALSSRYSEVRLRDGGSSAVLPPDLTDGSPVWPSLTVDALRERTAAREQGRDSFLVVDVREPSEHAASAIPDALLLPLDRLLTAEGRSVLPRDVPLVLHCHRSSRAARAAAALTAAGFTDVTLLAGGIVDWDARMTELRGRG
jgi:molybdopterin/thiamine biosynthesis adenylyltransferase/rhodanese-related sulfurtransferase